MNGVSRLRSSGIFAAAFAVAALTFPQFSYAQTAGAPAPKQDAPAAPSPEMSQSCPGLVAGNARGDRPRLVPASYHVAARDADQVRITFVGHATFLIESPQLVRIATDYNDYVRPPILPDIITMNHAHDTHYTDHPDPAIKYVLRGWSDVPGQPVNWDLTYRDVRVRNVPTNIRDGEGGTERYGNSIFVFEIANLCIAHLSHLHHTLTQQQIDEIGRVDVVMAPVDGFYTLDLDGMMDVLQAMKAPLIIPMHYFSQSVLDRFLDRARQLWDVQTAEVPSTIVSKSTLPKTPEVLVLPGH
ncbi:MAG TPA: MBL fold metallo-hydrolase [Xanthobacteraceae bacterium]|nr:MBL fold metallo-hydrolase [Xanthobacteraceae bacterium]